MSEDPSTLGLGIHRVWLSDLDEALSRVVVAGLAHPDPELPFALSLLGERAAQLGLPTAAAHLSKISATTAALRPGPPDLASRTGLAREAWDELMAMLAWLGLVRAELALREAGLRAKGLEVEAAREDVPRFSGLVWVDGLTLTGERLVIVGHAADGTQVLVFDPLAEVTEDDPFGSPVISRLFQSELWLGSLGHVALDFDRHPKAQRGAVVMLQPAFRAVPVVRPSSGSSGVTSQGVTEIEVHISVDGDGIVVRVPPAVRVHVGRTLKFNLLKRLVQEARGGVRLELRGLPRPDGAVVISAPGDDGLVFPTLDSRAWRLSQEILAQRLLDTSLWARVAGQGFPGGVASEPLRQEIADFQGGDTRVQQLSWWAARRGIDPPPWRPGPLGSGDEAGFAGVWLRLWHGHSKELKGLLEGRYAELPDPSLYDVCARALLLESASGDGDEAVDYLRAHLLHTVRRSRADPVLPSSGALLAAADTLAWLTGADRSGAIGDELEAPTPTLRERLAWSLYRWVVSREEGSLGDDLALASVSRWGETVVA